MVMYAASYKSISNDWEEHVVAKQKEQVKETPHEQRKQPSTHESEDVTDGECASFYHAAGVPAAMEQPRLLPPKEVCRPS